MPFHFLLTSIVLVNSELSFLLLLLREYTLFSLPVLKMLSVSLGFGSLSVVCLGRVFLVFPLLGFVVFLFKYVSLLSGMLTSAVQHGL